MYVIYNIYRYIFFFTILANVICYFAIALLRDFETIKCDIYLYICAYVIVGGYHRLISSFLRYFCQSLPS